MRIFLGVALSVCLGGSSLAQESVSPAPTRKVSFTRMAARIPVGTTWGQLQIKMGIFGCKDLEELTWSARDSQAVQAPEYEHAFRDELAAASYNVAGDPTNLFEDDDKSADLQVGALVTGISATFCGARTLREKALNIQHFELLGSATMEVEWQVYSTAQGRIVARVPTTGHYETESATNDGDRIILQRAFAANVRALAATPEFRAALSGPPAGAEPLASASRTPIALKSAPAGAKRAINEAAASVATVFAGNAWGSAFLVSRDGYLLTNHHVVGESTQVRVRWSDKSETIGEVVRSDRRRDVALVKVDPNGRTPLVLRHTATELGEPVFAIGTPLEKEFQNTVTKGIVSGNRQVKGQPFVQSDVAVDHGNSGGPLLDDKGQVVAITDWGYSPDGISHNLNFFIPIDEALKALALTPGT